MLILIEHQSKIYEQIYINKKHNTFIDRYKCLHYKYSIKFKFNCIQ